jgi:hypothetical protein
MPDLDPYAGHKWRRGDRVRLVALGGLNNSRLKVGWAGTVDITDSQGTVHVRWDLKAGPFGDHVYGVQPAAGDRIEPLPDPDIVRGAERLTGEHYDPATGQWSKDPRTGADPAWDG